MKKAGVIMIKKKLVDTTLRDGEQCPGIVIHPKEKLEMALLFDQIGFYEIEVGAAFENIEDIDFFRQLISKRKNAKISLWCRMRQEVVKKAVELQPDVLHIGVPVSYVQIYTKLNKNKDWVKRSISECLEVAALTGTEVIVGFEDASRADIGFMIRLGRYLEEFGVKTIRLADTVGIFTPAQSQSIVKELCASTGLSIQIHEHNDFGMAIANSILMAEAGAEYVDCTLFGMGERAGNCDTWEFLNVTERQFDFGVSKSDIYNAEEKLLHLLKDRMPEELYLDYLEKHQWRGRM